MRREAKRKLAVTCDCSSCRHRRSWTPSQRTKFDCADDREQAFEVTPRTPPGRELWEVEPQMDDAIKEDAKP